MALPAAATVVVAHTFEQMVAEASLVVKARVNQVQSSFNRAHTSIDTWVEVEVEESIKGTLTRGAPLLVRTPGGVVGEAGVHVAGAPAFRPGEQVVLFLERAGDDASTLVVQGLAAGKVTLEVDGDGTLRAMRDLSGLTFYDAQPGLTAPRGTLRTVARPEDLGAADAFIARLRKAARAAPGSAQ